MLIIQCSLQNSSKTGSFGIGNGTYLTDSTLASPATIPPSLLASVDRNPTVKSRLISDQYCTTWQKLVEFHAWSEAGMLANGLSTVLAQQIPLYIHNPAFDLFFGTDVRNYGRVLGK